MEVKRGYFDGGSRAFLDAITTKSGSGRNNAVSRLMPILSALESGAWSLKELEATFPMAKQILYGLIADGFVEQTQSAEGSTVFELTAAGRSFVKRQAYF